MLVHDYDMSGNGSTPDELLASMMGLDVTAGFWLALEPRDRSGQVFQPSWSNGLEGSASLSAAQPDPALAGAQSRLNNLGFDCGPPDGMMGPRTRACFRAFQEQQGLGTTGGFDAQTLERLSTSAAEAGSSDGKETPGEASADDEAR